MPGRSGIVYTFAQILQVKVQATHETLAAAGRLCKTLDLHATVIPDWAAVQVQASGGGAQSVSLVAADPTGVNMDRVARAMGAIDDIDAGRLPLSDAAATIDAIAQAPAAQTWLFAIAAAAGAAALSVIFGVQHFSAVALIVASSAAGAVLRRTISRYSTNALLQPLSAALLAGMLGALAVHYHLSSSLRLVAVSPSTILIPVPHLLHSLLTLTPTRT